MNLKSTSDKVKIWLFDVVALALLACCIHDLFSCEAPRPNKRHNFVSIVQVHALHRCDYCPEIARWKITIGDEIKFACEAHGINDARKRFKELKKSEQQ